MVIGRGGSSGQEEKDGMGEATGLKDLCYKHQYAGTLENQPRGEKEKKEVERNPKQWQRLLYWVNKLVDHLRGLGGPFTNKHL